MVTQAERREIYNRLLGKVLRRQSNSFDSDYNGGSSYFEESSAIYLYTDDTFRFEHSSFSSLSSGGLSLSSGEPKIQLVEGTWWVRSDGVNPVLELKYMDGSIFNTLLLRIPMLQGIEYLDNEPWNRYRIA
jgi:hypothetical protein